MLASEPLRNVISHTSALHGVIRGKLEAGRNVYFKKKKKLAPEKPLSKLETGNLESMFLMIGSEKSASSWRFLERLSEDSRKATKLPGGGVRMGF